MCVIPSLLAHGGKTAGAVAGGLMGGVPGALIGSKLLRKKKQAPAMSEGV